MSQDKEGLAKLLKGDSARKMSQCGECPFEANAIQNSQSGCPEDVFCEERSYKRNIIYQGVDSLKQFSYDYKQFKSFKKKKSLPQYIKTYTE